MDRLCHNGQLCGFIRFPVRAELNSKLFSFIMEHSVTLQKALVLPCGPSKRIHSQLTFLGSQPWHFNSLIVRILSIRGLVSCWSKIMWPQVLRYLHSVFWCMGKHQNILFNSRQKMAASVPLPICPDTLSWTLLSYSKSGQVNEPCPLPKETLI